MSCPYCGNKSVKDSYRVKEMMFGTREEFVYQECENCKSLYLRDIPSDLSVYYPAGYYSMDTSVDSSIYKSWAKRKIAEHRIEGKYGWGTILCKFLPEPMMIRIACFGEAKFNDRILDVGTGEGTYLKTLESLGFTDLTGVDPFIEESRTISKHIRLYKGELKDLEDKYDLIMLNHSFEHIENPSELMVQLRNRLAEAGKVLIRLPVAQSDAWIKYGTNWVQLDAPRHIHIPSEKGITELGKKNGLKLLKVEYESDGFMYWGSELYKRGVSLKEMREKGRLEAFFTKEEINTFNQSARRCNKNGFGDQAGFLFTLEN
jgi:2-polyprenyl-3-methyl-5-hydroxy-6-metoxy-1,4-benzoquinol methylase